MHFVGTRWNPSGTHPEPVVNAGGAQATVDFLSNALCRNLLEPVRNPSGTRGKYGRGLGHSRLSFKCILSEPVGTRSEPVVNVAGA